MSYANTGRKWMSGVLGVLAVVMIAGAASAQSMPSTSPRPDGRGWDRVTYERVWVEPVYRIVRERVWHEGITRTVYERVWVPDRYEWRYVDYDEMGMRCPTPRRVWVLVEPAHWEYRPRTVEVSPGWWEWVERRVMVTPGHWEMIERHTTITPGSAVRGEDLSPFSPCWDWPSK